MFTRERVVPRTPCRIIHASDRAVQNGDMHADVFVETLVAISGRYSLMTPSLQSSFSTFCSRMRSQVIWSSYIVPLLRNPHLFIDVFSEHRTF